MKSVTLELDGLKEEISKLEEPAAKQEEVTRLEGVITAAEATMLTSEEATGKAREAEQVARGPLETAEGKLREIETEARTLRQILNRGGQDLFPAVLERVTIEPGYETALGCRAGRGPRYFSGRNRSGCTGASQAMVRKIPHYRKGQSPWLAS